MADDVPESAIAHIRRVASYSVSTGRDQLPAEAAYYRRCIHLHWRSGTVVMFTRDTGHHTSGWFKNPDFERCLHLSLSFREPRPQRAAHELAAPHVIAALGGMLPMVPFDHARARAWVAAVLGDAGRLAWIESAKTAEGRILGVCHWRVFCDRNWLPIKPRGEVYSRELTDRGWQSWSDQHAEPNWLSAE